MNEKEKLEESINTILNINGLLIVLANKGLITSQELIEGKELAKEDLKKAYPKLSLINCTTKLRTKKRRN